MTFIIGWLPFIINVLLLFSDLTWIFLLPVSAIIGMIGVSIYYGRQADKYPEGSEERRYMERKRKEWTGATAHTITNSAKYARKGMKETLDVDSWKKSK